MINSIQLFYPVFAMILLSFLVMFILLWKNVSATGFRCVFLSYIKIRKMSQMIFFKPGTIIKTYSNYLCYSTYCAFSYI